MFNKATLLRAILLTLSVVPCTLTHLAQAQTVTPPPVQVGKCRGGIPSYSTIQAAVNAAATGATVNVCAGIYPEQVTISKNLKLVGVANGTANAAVIVPPSAGLVQNAADPSPASANFSVAAQLFVRGPAAVNLSNITVDGTNNQMSGCNAPTLVGIYYLNASGALTGLNVRNQLLSAADAACSSGLGIYLEGNTGNSVSIHTTTVTNYQKNGITANGYGDGSPGPVIYFQGNTVVGQGSSASLAQNGIQIGYGASGKVTLNLVADDVFANSSSLSDTATGILVYATNGANISNNKISTTQFAVAVSSDQTYGNADNNNVNLNIISGSQLDAVEVCSNNTLVQFNDIYSSGEAGVKVDSSCINGLGGGSSGNTNTVTKNNINGGCAAILQGSGTGNILSPNLLIANVPTVQMTGGSCPSPFSASNLSTPHAVPFR